MELRLGAFDEDGQPFPLLRSDVSQIESLLWKHSPFCFPVHLPARNRYSLISNTPIDATRKKHILFDRNVAHDIGGLFRLPKTDQSPRRLTVAIVLFLRFCKFLPAAHPALQEFESLNRGQIAYEETVSFSKAFACSIHAYLSLLNGEVDRLAEADVSKKLNFPPFDPNQSDYSFPYQWNLSYLATLKLVGLKRNDDLLPIQKIEHFLTWIHDNFFFTPPLLLVASQFFSAQGKKGIIKRARTKDREVLIEEARNAAWDLYVLLDWHIKLKQAEFCILASRDQALRELAFRLRDIVSSHKMNNDSILSPDWPTKKERGRIIAMMEKYTANLDDPSRPANQKLPREHYHKMAMDLESEAGIIPTIAK